MKDDETPEKIRRFLKENGYVVSKRAITQILNQMAQELERQINQSSGLVERPLLCEVIRFRNQIKIISELPGAFEESISINSDDNQLKIEAQSETRDYHLTVNLPPEANTKILESTFLNGLLEITVHNKRRKKKSR
jgi:HSP20 family molecular chaperone IbpA